MAVRNLKFHSNVRLRSNAFLLLSAQVLLLATGGLSAQAVDPERLLYSVETRDMDFIFGRGQEYQKTITSFQKHYVIRFQQDENFEFVIADEFTNPSNQRLWNKGFTTFHYNQGRAFLPIANQILKYRQALLAAEDYFDRAATAAGLEFNFAKSSPVQIVVGKQTSPDAGAVTCYAEHWICFRPDLNVSRNTAVHEYFHLIQNAVWARDIEHYHTISRSDREPFEEFLSDMTADWASDEPITVAASPGFPAVNLDLKQSYLDGNARHMIEVGDHESFAEMKRRRDLSSSPISRRYQANILIKYWAEQMAGQQDKSGAVPLLKALKRIRELGGANESGFFLGLTEPLPAQFDAPGEEYRWRQFFRHFCASNVVQRASLRNDASDPIGYHDEGMQQRLYTNKVNSTYRNQSRISFEKVWTESAQTDEQRRDRLKSIRGAFEEVRPLAHRLHLIDLDNSASLPRPVFLYATGDPGTDLYLLRQKLPHLRMPDSRSHGTFDLLSQATFSDQPNSPQPETMLVVEEIDFRQGGDYLWLGLVNPATQLKSRKVAWAYLASPRLMSNPHKPQPGDTDTVKLTGGRVTKRAQVGLMEFLGGDDFEIKIETSGALHRTNSDLSNLGPRDASLNLTVIDPQGVEIPLEKIDGKSFSIRATPHPEHPFSWNYYVSGRIPEDTETAGRCHFRIRLSSPLNLGDPDQQIDETYQFDLNPNRPVLTWLEVRQEQTVIYDSDRGIRVPPKDKDETYTMEVTASFSREMDQSKTTLTAGGSPPYTTFEITPTEWPLGSTFRGKLVIPKNQVRSGGMLLRFSVQGVSESAPETSVGHLDTDLSTEGFQPDTSHYLVLGPTEYWDASLVCHAQQFVEDEDKNLIVMGHWGPSKGKIRLIPFQGDQNHVKSLKHAISILDNIQYHIRWSETTVKQLEAEYKQVSDPSAKKSPELIEFRRQTLLREKRRLGFLKLRLMPLFEAVVRLRGGHRVLYFDPAVCGPMSASFEGMNLEWTPLLGEIEDQQSGRIQAPPWSTANIVADGLSTNEDIFLPSETVQVLDFWPSDIRKLRQLMQLTMHPPEYVTSEIEIGPEPSRTDARRRYSQQGLDGLVTNDVTYQLAYLSELLWDFVPPSDRIPREAYHGDHAQLRKNQKLWSKLPPLKTNRAISIYRGILVPRFPVRVHYEGTNSFLSRGKSDPGQQVYRDDASQFSMSSWWPEGQMTRTKNDWREKRKEEWLGIDPPYWVFRREPHYSVKFAEYQKDRNDVIQWNASTSHGYVNVELHPDDASIFIQPNSEFTSTTLRGSHAGRGQGTSHRLFNWKTTWNMHRIGDPPAPNPETPLPLWDKTLDEPPQINPLEEQKNSEKTPAPSKTDKNRSSEKANDPSEASSLDPNTGITTKSRRNADGSTTITTIDSQGKILSQKNVSQQQRQRPSASIRDPQSGRTITSERQSDGSVKITTRDADGRLIGEPVIRASR